MNPDQLRQRVARAVLPLLGEYETLTTARIARAADIDEADLLAVFADKEAVMQACVATLTDAIAAALDPAVEIRQLEAVRTDQPLASRLVEVIDILDAYERRFRIDIDDVLPADAPGVPLSVPPREHRWIGDLPELRQAVARVLEPDEQRLRLPAQVLAGAFVGMVFAGIRPTGPDREPLPAEQVVGLFLHGALSLPTLPP